MKWFFILLVGGFAAVSEGTHPTAPVEVSDSIAGTEPKESPMARSEAASSRALYAASTAALAGGNIEDAGFFYFCGRFRFAYDQNLYPPKMEGRNQAIRMTAIIQRQLNAEILPRLMQQPAVFERVLARIAQWKPGRREEYDPGWPYHQRVEMLAKEEGFATEAARFVDGMRGVCNLLLRPEYFSQYVIYAKYEDGRPMSEENFRSYVQACERMEEIEATEGIRGIMALR